MIPTASKQIPFLFQDFHDAAAAIQDALNQQQSYVLLLGESGCGKTTLLRYLHQLLDKNTFSILYLCNKQATGANLLSILAKYLHLPLWCSRVETASMVSIALKNIPTRILLWIDEAHLLRDDTLDELRLLCEADLLEPALFSVMLSALPSIKDRLLAPQLFPLLRRISTRIRMRGLQHEEIPAFLNHVLGNQTAPKFSQEALSLLFEHARGLPALLIDYCSRCLKTLKNTSLISKQQTIDIIDSIQSF
jgi:type II secretory pathway predicted ATPase ExeA